MPDLRWSRIDAPGGGLQAYYRGKWRLDVERYCMMDKPWRWELRSLVCGEWVIDAFGYTRRQRDAKHMAACALEMHVGEA